MGGAYRAPAAKPTKEQRRAASFRLAEQRGLKGNAREYFAAVQAARKINDEADRLTAKAKAEAKGKTA